MLRKCGSILSSLLYILELYAETLAAVLISTFSNSTVHPSSLSIMLAQMLQALSSHFKELAF